MKSQPYDIITLNVGGTKYQTTRNTLLSAGETFFTGMLSCEPNAQEEYFIDRDGEKFRDILNHLREPRDLALAYRVDRKEAAFYALPALPEFPLLRELEKHREVARKYLERHQEEIATVVGEAYRQIFIADANLLKLYIGKKTFLNEAPSWKDELRTLQPAPRLFYAFQDEFAAFYRPLGLECRFEVEQLPFSNEPNKILTFRWK